MKGEPEAVETTWNTELAGRTAIHAGTGEHMDQERGAFKVLWQRWLKWPTNHRATCHKSMPEI
jgi:hypothetical protein